jgi:hypothetical protein
LRHDLLRHGFCSYVIVTTILGNIKPLDRTVTASA